MSFLHKISGLTCNVLNKSRLQKVPSTLQVPCRWQSYKQGLRAKPMHAAHYLRKDGLNKNFVLIYKAPLVQYLSISNLISTCTASLLGGIVLYKSMFEELATNPISMEMYGLVSKEEDIYYFAAAFVAFNVAIRIFVNKYPIRIYRNADRYVAVYGGQIPFRVSKHAFVKGEVAQAKPFFLNPWRDSMYQLGSKKSILLVDNFKTSSEFYEMMK